MAAEIEEKPYRLAVGAAVFNRDGRVFIGRRRRKRETEPLVGGFEWQMPQGGIDPGEDAADAVRRELYEETNISSVSLLASSPDWYVYDLPREVQATTWGGRYRGQKQKWFAFRFLGDETEIDVERPAGGAHPPEFVEWRWERLDRLPDLIIPFKRGVYLSVVRAFEHFAKHDQG
jgi:putative (di)nucleoside polyphosphate hydrolase